MSLSPPIRRLSTASQREEALIYQYEAEEERIINVLSRKLEQLQDEKAELENALEAENERNVNRLSRQISALRASSNATPSSASSTTSSSNSQAPDPLRPDSAVLLESMRRENEALRSKVVDLEREFIKVSRLNEIYREELIQHRSRAGLSVDALIGHSSSSPQAQPEHPRHPRAHARIANANGGSGLDIGAPHVEPSPIRAALAASAVPIPRPPSQIHRPSQQLSTESTPSSSSAASTDLSPVLSPSALPASYVTNQTSLPSSGSPVAPIPRIVPNLPLTYPSVPPPSLASSLGSPVASLHAHMDDRDEQFGGRWAREGRRSGSHSESRERGYRIAETGSLRSRRGSAAQGAPGPSNGIADLGQPPLLET
ncbi:hypothetical protein PENSPDRAFT_747466 [Peniophora sp. CONT]|nr:hypothetical protein PENSPDRAFT_747466 [Peniophora sp. CONT]